MPHASQFFKFLLGRNLGNGACEGTQAVLAIFGKLPEGNLRVLGCIGSLSKTHTRRYRPFMDSVRLFSSVERHR